MRRHRGLLGVAVVVLVALAGCAPTPGPLAGLNRNITECVRASMYDDIAVGVVLDNTAREPLRLGGISFGVGPGISVTGMWVAAEDEVGIEHHGYGITEFPPDIAYTPGWVDRVDARGALIPAQTLMFLVVRLHQDEPALPGEPRTVNGLRIDYTVDHHPYAATSDFIAGFSVDDECDPSAEEF